MIEFIRKTYKQSKDALIKELECALLEEKKIHVVTANPEIMMHGDRNADYARLLLNERTLITPDGIGIVKAANFLKCPVLERIPGVEMVQELLKILDQHQLSLYCYGSKAEVLEKFHHVLKENYPDIKVVGLKDGYTNKEDDVFKDIASKNPDLILVALGVPRQELVIRQHFDTFSKGIFVGVGGSLDVLSGSIKRAPQIFIKLNLEWLYRIAGDPKRIKRFYNNNVKFFKKLKTEKRIKNEN